MGVGIIFVDVPADSEDTIVVSRDGVIYHVSESLPSSIAVEVSSSSLDADEGLSQLVTVRGFKPYV